MTAQTIIQSLASGLLMGLLYGLIAVGLALIFGLMDVVNFAHGEFLMIAMYATFFLFAFFAIDPLLSAPLVATDMPGEATIMPWKRVKFDEMGQNNDADPVLLQYVGGKFVTIFPTQAAVAEASWPMK